MIKTYPLESAASSSQASRAAEEEETGSICCDIYIDGEEQQKPQKDGSKKPLHVAAVLRGIPPQADRPLPADKPETRKASRCWVFSLFIVALLAVGLTVGISVGLARHKKHQPAVVLHGTGLSPLSASVTFSVPFATSTKLEVPAGRGGRTCDALFGDQQEMEKLVERLEAAHSRRLSQYQVDEVVVTELQCNGISYPVPAETFLAGKPASSVAASSTASTAGSSAAVVTTPLPSRRRLAEQQRMQRAQSHPQGTAPQQHSIAESESGPLVVYVELEAKRREQQDKVPPISSHVEWLQTVSNAGSALAGVLVPEILRSEFNLPQGSCVIVSVQQLNIEIISSQMVFDDIVGAVAPRHAGRKGYKGSTVVTRTELDPSSGMVTDTQTMRLPVLPDLIPELLPNFPSSRPTEDDTSGSGQAPQAPTDQQTKASCDQCSLPNTASSACVDGVCQIVACAPGWQDCDSAPENGCEVDVQDFFTDSNHCGSCNKVCLTPLTCQVGKCAIATLSPFIIPVATPEPQLQPQPQPEQEQEQKEEQKQEQQPEQEQKQDEEQKQQQEPDHKQEQEPTQQPQPQPEQPTLPPTPSPTDAQKPLPDKSSDDWSPPEKPVFPGLPLQPPTQPVQPPTQPQQPAKEQPPTKQPQVKPPAVKPKPVPEPRAPKPAVPESKPPAPKPTPELKPVAKAPSANTSPASPNKPTQDPKAPSPTAKPKPEQPLVVKPQVPEQPSGQQQPAAPQKPQEPSTPGSAVLPVVPGEPKVPVPQPTKPSVPAPLKPTKPQAPAAKPTKPRPALIELRDDVVRISPKENEVTLDVINNDDLRGANPASVKLSVVSQPTTGTVSVLPAVGAHGRPRLLYKQGKDKVEPGGEVELHYTVSVAGHPTPAPASALLLGSAAPSDSSLANCSASAAATAPGSAVPGLTRADDAAATVKLPFAVQLYGSSYTSATISSNGWVSLGSSGAKEHCNVEGSWPGAACLGTGPVLAPFWDDLMTDQVLTRHDAGLGAFVIQWTNVMAPSSRLPVGTFQAYLFPNGTMGYVYRDLYGTDQALGSSAVVGIRGPTSKASTFSTKLKAKALEKVGAGSDEHGTWLFSAHLDDSSDYVTTLGSHRRFLSPGVAMISHPSAGIPGKFKPWTVAAAGSNAGSSVLPLLLSPDAPARPVLLPLVTGESDGAERVVTLTWQLPQTGHSVLSPTFFKLYLSADPLFNELLRQPKAAAFKPDIPANSRSVDVEIDRRHAVTEVYALLLACNTAACSRSCIGHYSLA